MKGQLQYLWFVMKAPLTTLFTQFVTETNCNTLELEYGHMILWEQKYRIIYEHGEVPVQSLSRVQILDSCFILIDTE